MSDREFGEQPVEHGLAQIRRRFGNFEDRADVLFDGKAAEYRRLLRQITDAEPGAAIHRKLGDIAPIEADRPGIGSNQTGDDVETGRLSSTVRTEQADDFAALHRYVYVAQYRAPFEALAEALPEKPTVVGDQPRPALGAGLLHPRPIPLAGTSHGLCAPLRGAPLGATD
jgi:hypothetical protein